MLMWRGWAAVLSPRLAYLIGAPSHGSGGCRCSGRGARRSRCRRWTRAARPGRRRRARRWGRPRTGRPRRRGAPSRHPAGEEGVDGGLSVRLSAVHLRAPQVGGPLVAPAVGHAVSQLLDVGQEVEVADCACLEHVGALVRDGVGEVRAESGVERYPLRSLVPVSQAGVGVVLLPVVDDVAAAEAVEGRAYEAVVVGADDVVGLAGAEG